MSLRKAKLGGHLGQGSKNKTNTSSFPSSWDPSVSREKGSCLQYRKRISQTDCTWPWSCSWCKAGGGGPDQSTPSLHCGSWSGLDLSQGQGKSTLHQETVLVTRKLAEGGQALSTCRCRSSEKPSSPGPNSSCVALCTLHNLIDSGFPSMKLEPGAVSAHALLWGVSHPPADSQLYSPLRTVLWRLCLSLCWPTDQDGAQNGYKSQRSSAIYALSITQGPECS